MSIEFFQSFGAERQVIYVQLALAVSTAISWKKFFKEIQMAAVLGLFNVKCIYKDNSLHFCRCIIDPLRCAIAAFFLHYKRWTKTEKKLTHSLVEAFGGATG